MTASLQPTAVAGSFYPAEPDALARMIDSLMRGTPARNFSPKAVIAPHAGYVYSGAIQAAAYAPLANRRGTITRVVLLGPNHRMAFKGCAISPAQAWATPLGPLAVDWEALRPILNLPDVAITDAPFRGEHSLEVQLPFIRAALGDVAIIPILVGDARPAFVAAILRALWGGPETAIVISSDLSHYHDDATARAKDAEATRAIELLRDDLLKDDLACGRRAIYGLLAEARSRDLRVTTLDLRNSGETSGPKDRVVGYGTYAFEYAHEARIDKPSRSALFDLARQAIAHGLARGRAPKVTVERRHAPALAAQRASFVTLELDGRLRGCIGTLVAHRPLVEDVAENAFKAAFADPRFKPLTQAEIARIDMHVSLLSHPRPSAAANEDALVRMLQPDIDGLIIRDQGKQAIFLPSVWSSIPDPRAFVRALKRKAGLPEDHWSENFRAFRYVTESFGSEVAATTPA
jgi:AmmeMemoRadiSam system protein B/AmmeMemoRadiSam system protein A